MRSIRCPACPRRAAEQLNTLPIRVRAAVVHLVLVAYVRVGKQRFVGEAYDQRPILAIRRFSTISLWSHATLPPFVTDRRCP